MANYLVTWAIDIEADSPEQAGIEALRIQRDEESIATCFTVEDEQGSTHEFDLDIDRLRDNL